MKLSEFFAQTPSGALAFSGGTDSSFLAWTAMKYGTGWKAYYIKTAFQPTFELEDAKRVAEQCGIPLRIIPVDVFAQDAVTANPSNRCYFCKRILFEQVLKQATKDGCQLVIDGTNASDDAGDRPGMQALRELEVRSPLREAGLTKADVRRLSREAGLFTWTSRPMPALPQGSQRERSSPKRRWKRWSAASSCCGKRASGISASGSTVMLRFCNFPRRIWNGHGRGERNFTICSRPCSHWPR